MDLITTAMALSQFAPSIVKWLSGSERAADAAARVVEIAQNATGAGDGQAALEALRADPGAVLMFRQALVGHEVELDKAYLADRADARARDVAFVQAGRRNLRADLMVVADAVGLVACLVVLGLYRSNLPGEAVALISTIASIFGLCLRDAHQFEFGSSRGAKDRDELLAASQSRALGVRGQRRTE